MIIFNSFIDILISLIPLWTNLLLYIFCLFFIATVPCLIRNIISWR